MPELTLQKYELYYILPVSLNEEQVVKVNKQVEESLLKIGAINLATETHGLKKLQYKIKGHESGNYIMLNFDLDEADAVKIVSLEKSLSYNLDIIRYIIVNQTEYIQQKSKESLNPNPEFTDHRQLNKGLMNNKKCIFTYLGRRVVDYKETEFLKQFMSPYAKIFGRQRTGLSAKAQRKVTKAIKRARHMALLPFVGE
jgi:small subunit ribosomal protein S18